MESPKKNYRYRHIYAGIQQFKSPKSEVIYSRHFGHVLLIDLSFGIFDTVVAKKPPNGGDGIQAEHIKVLVFLNRFVGLGRAMTEQWRFSNVVVDSIYIGPRVV